MKHIDFGFDVITLVATVLAASRAINGGPVPQHDSILTGQRYYAELMATRNSNRFHTAARMDKETFFITIGTSDHSRWPRKFHVFELWGKITHVHSRSSWSVESSDC